MFTDKACGLDVHKDSVFACILDREGKINFEGRFGTLTPELDRLRQTLVEYDVGRVAMESTSIYWMPIWRVLDGSAELTLANPQFIKQLPGRKSDVKDARWIAEVHQKNQIKGSYVPSHIVQQMRQYARGCRNLTKQIVRVEQQMDNQLQRCNIRFSNYVSNSGGNKSLRKVVNSLVEGVTKPDELAGKVHGRTLNRHGTETITAALTGVVNDVDRTMLKQQMEQIELFEKQQATCLTLLEELAMKHFAEEISLLQSITGIGRICAIYILAEIGGDMSVFHNAAALVGWAGLRPRNDESAGKVFSRRIMHGNKYLRQCVVEAAWAAAHSKNGFFHVKYQNLCDRKSAQKAILAIARKILVVIYNVLTKKEAFDPTRNLPAAQHVASKLAAQRKAEKLSARKPVNTPEATEPETPQPAKSAKRRKTATTEAKQAAKTSAAKRKAITNAAGRKANRPTVKRKI